MVAVIDLHVDDGIVIGAAASAGEFRRLVDHHALTFGGQLDGGGKAGETGADDVDRAGHQPIPWRISAPTRRSLLVFTGVRGGAQPRARRRVRI